jgi:hypothetical protein
MAVIPDPYPPLSDPAVGEPLSSGEALYLRPTIIAGEGLNSGTGQFSYWTACKTETVSHVVTLTGGTAVSVPTWAEIALYSADPAGDLTQLATTGNIESSGIWGSEYTEYTSALGTAVQLAAGSRYAVGLLSVAATPPALAGQYVYFADVPPVMSASLSGLSELPASEAAASLTFGSVALVFQAIVKP